MAEGTERNLGGRRTDYRPEMAEQAEKLCRLGATDKELADFFDVTEQTVNNWKSSQPGFFESLKKGKILADAEVANSLYNRALGSDDYPPDTTACIFWLKNRQPGKWRDKVQTEVTVTTHEQWLDELDEDDEPEGEAASAEG